MKRDTDDIIAGLDRLSSAITVLGTFTTYHKCETDEAEVSRKLIEQTYDLLADYSEMLREQLEDIAYPESNIHVLNNTRHTG